MKTVGIAFAALLAGAAPLAAQQSTTVQQDFEAATALDEKGDVAGSLAAWQALQKRITGNPRNLAIVLVRKGDVLFELGRDDEAIAATRAGLAGFPAADATLNQDREQAYTRLGRNAELTLDYASAATDYRQALSFAEDPQDQLSILRGLVESEIFTDPDRATADLAVADKIIGGAKVDKKQQATFLELKSESLMNRGDFTSARRFAGDAVDKLGGLTVQIDLNDVSARSDYAIAALLAGDEDDARKYLAYSGAGESSRGSLDPGAQMKMPYCGGDDGLRPDQSAVIEFSIGEDGSVIASRPIYAQGGGQAALVFARAARSWSWTPEQMKELPAFFRYEARVEMRCSDEFERPSLGNYLDQELGAWLAQKNVPLPPPAAGSDASVMPGERAALTRIEGSNGRNSLALLPSLYVLVENSVVGREEINALATRALAIADANGITPVARLAIDRWIWETQSADEWTGGAYEKIVSPAIEAPVYAQDAKARAAIRLLIADSLRRDDEDRARLLLTQVADDGALAKNDPLHVGALIRLASIDAADGKLDLARTAFDRSGLSADQCALLDAPPKLVRSNAGSGDFPMEALRWGFEGWTKTQYDIDADGKVTNARVITAYPPFVFAEASQHMSANFRYAKTYRPGGGLGCGGETQNIRFLLPDR